MVAQINDKEGNLDSATAAKNRDCSIQIFLFQITKWLKSKSQLTYQSDCSNVITNYKFFLCFNYSEHTELMKLFYLGVGAVLAQECHDQGELVSYFGFI